MRTSVPRLLASLSLSCSLGLLAGCGGEATTSVTPAPTASLSARAGDGGAALLDLQWTVEDSGTTLLSAISGSGPTDVWAVGPRVILHSRGDGQWVRAYEGTAADSLTTVFTVGGTVFAAGSDCKDGVCSNGVILRSRDGGATWTRQVVANTGFGFSSGGDTVYLAANELYASGDGFDSFEHLQPGFATAVGVQAVDSGLLAFGGSRGGIITRSADGGQSWQTVFSGVVGSHGGHIDQVTVAGSRLFALGNACSVPGCFAALVRSDDSGQTWQVTDAHVLDYGRGLWAAAADDLYVAGTRLVHSQDGTTFTPVDLPVTTQWAGVWGSSAADVYVIGTDGAIVHGRGAQAGCGEAD